MTAIIKFLAPVEKQDPPHALGSRIQTTFDAISASHWSRVTFYSHKVRYLFLDISLDSSSIDIIRRLEAAYGERLLPKISSVFVKAMAEQSETFSLAFGSALNSANFSSTPNDHDQHKMISLLGSTLGSQISSLMLMRRALPPPDLSHFSQLRQLRYKHAIQRDNWFHIAAACPRLRKLIFIELGSPGRSSGQTTEETHAIFPELESLTVLYWRVPYFLDLIERSTMPCLRDVNLTLQWSAEDDAILKLNRLRARTPHLSSLSLVFSQEFSAEVFREVLSWKGLLQLRLYQLKFVEMSMESLEEILPLGARLEEFCLWQGTQGRPRFPLWGLTALARHLVHLVELRLTVDMKDFDPNATAAANFSPFRMLKTLCIEILGGSDSLDDVSPTLATFLVTICPSLEKITVLGGNHPGDHPMEDMYWKLRRQGGSREWI
ncbi:hypothetical protein FRC05_007035 [Tulasnella sp. 425]|nr:hypothetical protein FRC05_007035 [Tulasnella sp. 425]